MPLTIIEANEVDELFDSNGMSAYGRDAEMRVAYATAPTNIQNVLTKLGVHSKLAAGTLAARNRVGP